MVLLYVASTDEVSSTLETITGLKAQLSSIIEPDFGLLDQLLSLGVLTRKDYDDIRYDRRAPWRRSEAVLDLLTSDDMCREFLKALQRTDQQHVVNLITHNGQNNNNLTLQSINQSNNSYAPSFLLFLGQRTNSLLLLPFLLSFPSLHAFPSLSFSPVLPSRSSRSPSPSRPLRSSSP